MTRLWGKLLPDRDLRDHRIVDRGSLHDKNDRIVARMGLLSVIPRHSVHHAAVDSSGLQGFTRQPEELQVYRGGGIPSDDDQPDITGYGWRFFHRNDVQEDRITLSGMKDC